MQAGLKGSCAAGANDLRASLKEALGHLSVAW